MRMQNTESQFGMIAIVLHWLMAILLIGLLIMGIWMTRMPISLQKLLFYGWHKEWGMLAFILVFFRLGWRLCQPMPALDFLPKWEQLSARSVHGLFYVFMIILPLTGWLVTSMAGLPVSFFGWFVFPDWVSPQEKGLSLFIVIHAWLAYALIILIVLHTSAAFKHQFINKDTIFRRMLWP